MVVGNGMVAKCFESYKDNSEFIIFASGVSNSKISDEDAFNRELSLLRDHIRSSKRKTLVYFSTCSFYDPEEKNSPYLKHKKEIESVIIKNQPRYYIFRVSNLVGNSKNMNTILNFFVYHIKRGINFDLWVDAQRNLIDVDDMFKIVDYILTHKIFENQIINIANPKSYPVRKIIMAIEELFNTKANFISVNKGSQLSIDTSDLTPILKELNIKFDKDYLKNLLTKYHSTNEL